MRRHLLWAILATACSANPRASDDAPVAQPQTPSESPAPAATPALEPQPEPETSAETSPAARDVSARVQAAKARLGATEAGQRIWRAIEAHGGLEKWLGSGPLHFRFTYRPLGRDATDTYQIVDPWSSLARHKLAADPSLEFGWDGEKAWVNPPDSELATNARFWSLTPYYFVGMPFVLGDPGVRLESLPDAEFEGKGYDLVKASFEAGVGDAPDDYYILYLDKESSRVRALRYVVSYKGFRPEGGHGPEKLMAYDGTHEVGGLLFAASHRTFKYDEATGEIGEKVTDVEVSEMGFRPGVDSTYFQPPAGARLITGWK